MIKLNDVEIKLDKYPDGTFLFKDIPPIGPKNLIEWFFESNRRNVSNYLSYSIL